MVAAVNGGKRNDVGMQHHPAHIAWYLLLVVPSSSLFGGVKMPPLFITTVNHHCHPQYTVHTHTFILIVLSRSHYSPFSFSIVCIISW